MSKEQLRSIELIDPAKLVLSPEMPSLNALSIDVEEHFHVHAFAKWIRSADWDTYESRVVNNTQRILRLLHWHDVQATFFVLGWVAHRHPELVQEIADGGHEIASHGYMHQLVYEQSATEFAEDIERSLEAISAAVPNCPIRGYRAPSFSISDDTPWVQDTLLRFGFEYDSSIFPVAMHDRYGVPSASRFAHQYENGLWEFPMSTMQMFGRNLPVGGGGYFRLYPYWLTQRAIRTINNEGCPAIFYMHPWEVDTEQPRVSQATRSAQFRHYVNIHKVEERLENMLKQFRFGPISRAFAAELTVFKAEQPGAHRYLMHTDEINPEDRSAASNLTVNNPDTDQNNPDYAHRNRNSGGALLSPSSPRHAVS